MSVLEELPKELNRLTRLTDMCGGENTYEEVLQTIMLVWHALKTFQRAFLLDRIASVVFSAAAVGLSVTFAVTLYMTSWTLYIPALHAAAACVCAVCVYRSVRRRSQWKEMIAEVSVLHEHFSQLGVRCVKEKLENDLRRQ